MNLTPEEARELTKFPAALKELVRTELETGNAIEEVGHTFPAPPAGAYVRLANAITTRLRVSDNGLLFREHNGSGEFTDAEGFYFVMEPLLPPPPYPDMDAIRKAQEVKPGDEWQFDH